jgi:hypothetical protein
VLVIGIADIVQVQGFYPYLGIAELMSETAFSEVVLVVKIESMRRMSSILKLVRRGLNLPVWITSLMSRRPFKVVAVALERWPRLGF